MNIEDILGLLSPEASAFVTAALEQGEEEVVNTILQVIQSAPTIEEGVAMIEQAIQEFLASSGGPGVDPAMAGAPPPGMDPMLAAGAPPGMPPPMPPGMDPTMGMPQAGPMPPGATDPLAPPAEGSVPAQPERPKPKKKKVPKYKPPKVPKRSKPTYEQILEDARQGRDLWKQRDARIKDDYALYHMTYDEGLFGDKEATTIGGTVVHKRTQPVTLVDRVTALCTARNGMVTTEVEPRANDDEHVNAAQAFEDFILYARECDEEAYLERGGYLGDPQPPLPRKEAGLAAIEGGFGWCWYVDNDTPGHPFQYEIVPLSQLYPIGPVTTRQYTLTLGRARAQFEKVREQYKDEDKGRLWNNADEVRVIVHADNAGVYRSMVWEDLGKTSSGGSRVKSIAGTDNWIGTSDRKDRWIEEPRRLNFGFPYFNYMIWGGSPAEPVQNAAQSNLALRGYGVLTMLRRTFKLMDLFISAVATGALTAQEPATMMEAPVDVDPKTLPNLDRRPGATTKVPGGTKIHPIRWDFSQSQDAQTLMNSLLNELQDVQSPMLTGGAPATSGIDRMIGTEQASQLVVGPIIDALEKWYALMHKQRGILALRYSNDDEYNKDDEGESLTMFEEYEKRSYRGSDMGEYGVIKPSDIEKSGVRVVVRYHREDTNQEIALAQMVTGLVNAHLMSQESALRRLGVKNPKAEIERIFSDGAVQDPTVLKAMIETAVYNSGNQLLIQAWDKAFYADTISKSQGGGSPPAPTGTASQPNVMNGPSSAIEAPGAQMMGMMGV